MVTLIVLIGPLFVVGLIGAAIYGRVQMNKPENVEKRRIAENKRKHKEQEDRDEYGGM